MKYFLYNSILYILFVNANTLQAQKNINGSTLNHGLTISKSVKPDSPKRTIINFLKWYKSNEARLNQIGVLKGGLPDTTTFYYVDFKNSETYLNELKKCNFLSDAFLYDLRKRFADLDSILRRYPQNDGPVLGYDYDPIMKAQDYMDVWKISTHQE